MFEVQSMKRVAAGAALALGMFGAALPALADPVDWTNWSDFVVGTMTGSATATFAASGVTARYTGELEQFVANYPSYNPGTTFSGGTVDNAPPSANGIIRIFGGSNTGTNTITFSQAVVNPVFAIWSLGQPGITAQFNFDQPFTIQSGGPNAEYGGSSITAVGNTVFGNEGNGVIQFIGTVTSISWTNPIAENWYGFTVGLPITAAVPEPQTYALLLAGLGAIALAARRRASR